MEESREPQQTVVTPVIYQPVYPTPQNPAFPPAAPVKASRWTRLWRMNRLVLRRLIYGATVAGRVMRPYAAFIAIIIALLGVIGWMSYLLLAPTEAPPVFQRADSLPPAVAIENFIKGQQNFNVEMIWDSYSTDYQANQLAKGASKATLQAEANSHRSAGLQYVHYDYIGGVSTATGGMYFYSVDIAVQNQQPRVWIIFNADKDGKIVGIDTPVPLLGSNKAE